MTEQNKKLLEQIIDQEDDETLLELCDKITDAIEKQDCITTREYAEGLGTLVVYSYFTDYLVEHDEDILAKARPIIEKQERERIRIWGDERVMCEHLAYYHRRKTCEGCWQALKEGD